MNEFEMYPPKNLYQTYLSQLDEKDACTLIDAIEIINRVFGEYNILKERFSELEKENSKLNILVSKIYNEQIKGEINV